MYGASVCCLCGYKCGLHFTLAFSLLIRPDSRHHVNLLLVRPSHADFFRSGQSNYKMSGRRKAKSKSSGNRSVSACPTSSSLVNPIIETHQTTPPRHKEPDGSQMDQHHHRHNQQQNYTNRQPQPQQQQQQQQYRFRKAQTKKAGTHNPPINSINQSSSMQQQISIDRSSSCHNDDSQQLHHHQQQQQQQHYELTELDNQSSSLCDDVHCSIMRAIDSSRQMPLEEHVLYSSYETYDNIMIEQRKCLVEMMSKLSACSDKQDADYYQSYGSSLAARTTSLDQNNINRVEYSQIDSLRDKYDTLHDFSEHMFDKIGQNLDDAAGLTLRDAQLVQTTLEAAKQNRLTIFTEPQTSSSRELSSSSSSSSLTKQPIETNSSTSSTGSFSSNQQQYRYKKPQTKVVSNQVNSVVQSSSMHVQRNQHGGYFGKQYGAPNQRYAMLENKNIARPQNQFRDKIDNSYRPFEPLIRVKPNASNPLRLNIECDEQGNEFYLHPYEQEIKMFPIEDKLTTLSEPIEPPRLDLTPIVLVENVQQLEEMCRHIEAQKEFAVDVEHHSYRSFQGITCLIQISTRTQDFVIDAIKLRSELYRLNESFTNPNIVKVFHGADCDILWLQRDFGVYVVNLFDTSRAAKLMKFAHLSLAFLMKHYCNVESDKSYQLADWRDRPLPLPMLQYARADTHYLLYIHDRLRNDLLMKGGPNEAIGTELVKAVYERGKEICLKRYEKPPFSNTSHLSVLRKSRSTFNAKQMFAFKELYAWRDSISRELDESVGYVLPNNLMIRIAEYLPREPQGITALCNPIPPTVKKYLSDIHAVILKAIDIPLEETSKVMISNHPNMDPSLRSIDLDSISHKQDIAHSAGMQETSVPILLDKMHINCSNDEKNRFSLNGSNRDTHTSRTPRNVMMHKNVNQSPSRLCNFLDSSRSKSHDQSHHNDVLRVRESIEKQFVSPYQRCVASNKN